MVCIYFYLQPSELNNIFNCVKENIFRDDVIGKEGVALYPGLRDRSKYMTIDYQPGISFSASITCK
jgi:hypothetical protein